MHSEDEQHQTLSGGNRADRTDLHLSSEEQSNITMQESDSDSNSLSGSFSDKTEDFTELQKGILCFDNYLIHKRPEIAGYFQSEQDAVLQTEYLKNSFRMEEFTELYIGDVRAGYRADEDGLTMWKGNYLTHEAESRLSWEDARYWVNSYIEDGVYLLPGEVAEQIDRDGMFKQLDLFTMFSEQVGNIAMKQAEEKSDMPTGFVLPEKQIDDILRSGGGRDDSRKRIYAKYRQGKTPEEMAAFLKKEYGTTGKGFEFDGKQIAVWFDEGGMSVGYGTSATEHPILTMEWKDIEQNIRRQVENGTYMGANEAYLVDEVERNRTGTPISNSMTELYTNMRYLQYGTLSKLKLMKANHTSQKYRLEDNIAKHYPQQITILKERISGMQADIQTAKSNLPVDKEQFSMKVGDKLYTDKKEAGTALVEMCKEIKTVNAPAVIGEYAGFRMAVSFDAFNHKFVMNLKGQLSHNLEVGSDPLGNISRINHALESMPRQLMEAQTKLETVEHQLETAKVEVTKPFAQEVELAEKLERLSALNALLNMDEKGNDGIDMDDEPEAPKSEEEVADRPAKNIPLAEKTVGTGQDKGVRQYADAPAERVSLKAKLEVMKAKVAGGDTEKPMPQKVKGKEVIM